jgi:glutamate/tyrosine decarboxylase-like PLP-dependent enzyme
MKTVKEIPETGYTRAEMAELLSRCKLKDARWDQGKVFGFVYHPGEYYSKVAEEYLHEFLYESTLNPSTFPSLKDFERDIVQMATGLMHGNRQVTGNVTTGGTESIFLALKVARELAREKMSHQDWFEVILPETIHPAFLKACDYLSLKAVLVPVGSDKRADPLAMEGSITGRTILLACSAPCFPYGIVDPVGAMGEIAKRHHLPLHVDACMGGFILPFLEELGYPVPSFDFRVPGVTSVSLDAHKYGYAPKGTSILLFRNRAMRKKQFFVHTDWPGGIFASTTFMGTKSGGPLAGCWAVMNHLGKEGYRTMAGKVMQTTLNIAGGIRQMTGLQLLTEPDMSVLAFTSTHGDIHQIGDELALKGWHLDRLQFPDALHMTITQLNTGKETQFMKDLQEIVSKKESLERKQRNTRISSELLYRGFSSVPGKLAARIARKAGSEMGGADRGPDRSQSALYGISASFQNRKNMKDLVINLLDGMF